jgi:hypothetical protein
MTYYDVEGRLVTAVIRGVNGTCTYDGCGNRGTAGLGRDQLLRAHGLRDAADARLDREPFADHH